MLVDSPFVYFEEYSDCGQDCLSLDCPTGWAGDVDWCDEEYKIPECGFDLGYCDITCNSNCEIDWLGDEECDEACNLHMCNLDNGDCGFCSNVEGNNCDGAKIANDTCDDD